MGGGLVAVALAIVFWAFSQSALPPGGDPGHWIATSTAFLGRPYPAADFTLHPFLYPPLIFVVVGASLATTGSPVTAGFLAGGVLIALFGLTAVHLSRRYLLSGPFQYLFVGLAVLNGTTLQILFWGGYPNLLALALCNEGLIFLYAFMRNRTTRNALLLYGVAALIYLTHDLTFAIFASILIVTALVLVLQDRRWLRVFVSRPNLYGIGLLAGVIGAYLGATAVANIPHPGYLFSNPAAFTIDNIGEFFRPLGYAPLWTPSGGGWTESPVVVAAILSAFAISLVAGLVLVQRTRPSWVSPRLTIAGSALVATCIVPVGGYLAHIDTDYTRFVYFAPLPFSLFVVLILERAFRPWLLGGPLLPGASPPGTPPEIRRSLHPRPARAIAVVAISSIVFVLIAAEVAIPTVWAAEQPYTSPIHDAEFVSAMEWLRSNGTSGAVLAPTGDVLRWTEAIAGRDAVGPGPTWLDFYAAQVLGSEESGVAWNSQYAISDNEVLLSVNGYHPGPAPLESTFANNSSGLNASEVGDKIGQGPMYSVFADGILIPILRVEPLDFEIITQNQSAPPVVDAFGPGWKLTSVALTNGSTPQLEETYQTPTSWLNETITAGPGANATINFTVTPDPQWQIHFVKVGLLQPNTSAMLTPTPSGSLSLSYPAANFDWAAKRDLGQESTPTTIGTSGSITSSNPSFVPSTDVRGTYGPGGMSNPTGYIFSIANPVLSDPVSLTLNLSSDVTGNPATVFPATFNASSYLDANDVRFAVVQNISNFLSPFVFLESDLGFAPVYENSQWWVLAR